MSRVCRSIIIALILGHFPMLYCDFVGLRATDVGLTASHAESKVSPCRQADPSPRAEVIMEPEVNLPEVSCNSKKKKNTASFWKYT